MPRCEICNKEINVVSNYLDDGKIVCVCPECHTRIAKLRSISERGIFLTISILIAVSANSKQGRQGADVAKDYLESLMNMVTIQFPPDDAKLIERVLNWYLGHITRTVEEPLDLRRDAAVGRKANPIPTMLECGLCGKKYVEYFFGGVNDLDVDCEQCPNCGSCSVHDISANRS